MKKLLRYCLLLLCMCGMYTARCQNCTIRVQVTQNFIDKYREEFNYSANYFTFYLKDALTNNYIDSATIEQEGTCSFRFTSENWRYVDLIINNEFDESYLLLPGDKMTIRLIEPYESELSGKSTSAIQLFLQYLDIVDSLWMYDLSYITEMDSITYNRHFAQVLIEGNKIIENINKKIPEVLLKELHHFNHLNWGIALMDYALYKRKTEKNKSFNFVDKRYAAPLLPLIQSTFYSKECIELQKELMRFNEKLESCKYETRLFNELESNCKLASTKDVYRERDDLLCAWGYKYRDGTWFIPARFEEVKNFFTNNMAIVKINGYYGVINACQQFVIEPVYQELNWLNNHTLICKENNLYGLRRVDDEGIDIEPAYADIKDFRKFYYPEALAENENPAISVLVLDKFKYQFSFIDTSGRTLLKNKLEYPPWYITPFIKDQQLRKSDIYFKVKLFNPDHSTPLVGVMDLNGTILFASDTFSDINCFVKHDTYYFHATCQNTGALILLNDKGQVIYPQLLKAVDIWPKHIFLYQTYTSKPDHLRYLALDASLNPIIPQDIIGLFHLNNHVVLKAANQKYYLMKDSFTPHVIDSFDSFEKTDSVMFRNTHWSEYESHGYWKYFYTARKQHTMVIIDQDGEIVKNSNAKQIVLCEGKAFARRGEKLFLPEGVVSEISATGFDYISPLTAFTYAAKKGNTVYVIDSNYQLVFNLQADTLYIPWNTTLLKGNLKKQMKNGILGQFQNQLFKIKWCNNKICTEKIIPERYLIFHWLEHVFFLNKEGHILYKTENNLDGSGDYISSMAGAIEKEQTFKALHHSEHKPSFKSAKHADIIPVYNIHSNPKTEVVEHLNELVNLNWYDIFYYMIKTESGKYGVAGADFALKLDTCFDAIIASPAGNLLVWKKAGERQYKEQIKKIYQVWVYNKTLKCLGSFNQVEECTFASSDIINLSSIRGTSNLVHQSYKLSMDTIIPLDKEKLKFIPGERLYWGMTEEKWYLYNANQHLLCSLGFYDPPIFRFGFFEFKHLIISKTGKIYSRSLTNHSDFREELVKADSDNPDPDDYPPINNLSRLNFKWYKNNHDASACDEVYASNYCLDVSEFEHPSMNRYSFKADCYKPEYLQLAEDRRYSPALVQAINWAIISRQGFCFYSHYNSRSQFTLLGDHLFRFSLNDNHSNTPLEMYNYIIMNDSVFEFYGGLNNLLVNYCKIETWSNLSTAFYNKLTTIKGLQFKHNKDMCSTPDKSLIQLKPLIALNKGYVQFIVNGVLVFQRETTVEVKFTYEELLPYLEKGCLLERWFNHGK